MKDGYPTRLSDFAVIKNVDDAGDYCRRVVYAPHQPIYGGQWGVDPAPVTLHIASRYGVLGGVVYRVTGCGRIAHMWYTWTGGGIDSALQNDDWKLCPRCGDRNDFESALEEQKRGRERDRQRRVARERRERASRLARLAAMEAELNNFEQAYITPDAPLIEDHKKTGSYGRAYKAGDFTVWLQVVNEEV